MDTKKLRQKILDLAIRGKLVPQDPNDEPASVLLERIRAEKEQLIKEGKIKRSKKSVATDKSHYENVPFEIPESWCWTTLGELCSIKGGKRLPKGKSFADTITPHIYIRVTDMKDHTVLLSSLKYIDEDVFAEIKNYTISSNDLYLTIAGTIGDVGLVPAELDGANLTENAAKLTDIKCSKQYLMYVLMSSIAQDHFCSRFHQVAQPKLSLETASSTLIPLPPYREQLRIAEELDRWLGVVVSVEDDLSELTNYVRKTKSKILDLAISGKLVPQDLDNEPAIELLKRINPGFEPCDNSHYENIEFDIPKHWVWATVGDIFEHNTGKALNASNPIGTMLDYITTSNLYWDRFELSIIKQMPFTESEIERCIVRKGDLLICEGGDIGRAAIWNYDHNIMIQNHIHRLRGKVDICTRYFFYLFMHYKLHNLIGGKGVAIQGLSSRDLHNLIIPVPSLKEQYDIASSIDLYFSKLDMITAEL